MPGYINDPRRAPRLPVRLHVDVTHGSAVWAGATEDFSPCGCLLVSGVALTAGMELSLRFRADRLGDALAVEAAVTWVRGQRCGVMFRSARGGDPWDWYRRLVTSRPDVHSEVGRVRRHVRLDAQLFVSRPAPGVALGADEKTLVGACRDGMSAGRLALETRLPPARFVHALYALLDRAVLTSPDVAAAVAGAPRLARPRSRSDHQVAGEIALAAGAGGEVPR